MAFGITLPLQRGPMGYFESATDAIDQIKSNLSNLLLTQKGERVMQPTFGSDLYQYVFEPETDDAFANLQASVEDAVNTWMPFVQILSVTKTFDQDHNTTNVVITFSVIIDPTNLHTVTVVF